MSGKKNQQQKDEPKLLSNKNTFILSLREGIGFTRACIVSGNHPEEVTKLLLGDSAFMDECDRACRASNAEWLKLSSDLMQKGKYEQAMEARKKLFRPKQLIWWASACKADEVTPMKVYEVLVAVGDSMDAATACGMTYTDFASYLAKNPAIESMVSKMSVL